MPENYFIIKDEDESKYCKQSCRICSKALVCECEVMCRIRLIRPLSSERFSFTETKHLLFKWWSITPQGTIMYEQWQHEQWHCSRYGLFGCKPCFQA